MATIREVNGTKNGRGYQAIIRKRGYSLSRVLPSRAKAKEWATQVEAAISLDSPTMPFVLADWTGEKALGERAAAKEAKAAAKKALEPDLGWTCRQALERYRDTISGTKASPKQEGTRIRLLIESIGHIELAKLSRKDMQAHVDRRTEAGKGPATVRLELMQMRALWKYAGAEPPRGWGLELPTKNPCDGVILPPLPPGRDRRLQDAEGDALSEEQAIRVALAGMPDGKELVDIFDLALITGMRRGEILGLKKSEIQRSRKILRIVKAEHKTAKRGHVRKIVLTAEAAGIIQRRVKDSRDDKLFTLKDERFKHFWRKARKEAGVPDLHFHDCRHEGISRMAEKGLTIGQLQAQSGHRTAAMLMRYVNAKDSDILAKLS